MYSYIPFARFEFWLNLDSCGDWITRTISLINSGIRWSAPDSVDSCRCETWSQLRRIVHYWKTVAKILSFSRHKEAISDNFVVDNAGIPHLDSQFLVLWSLKFRTLNCEVNLTYVYEETELRPKEAPKHEIHTCSSCLVAKWDAKFTVWSAIWGVGWPLGCHVAQNLPRITVGGVKGGGASDKKYHLLHLYKAND